MEKEYKVEILFNDGVIYDDKVKALNELEALDKMYIKWKNIKDIKVVK